jgi:small subunit ribosomal protein S17e
MPVKPEFVKEIGKEIREKYPSILTKEFSKNKDVVNKVTNIESKTVRNRVAGYITNKERSQKVESED